MRITVVGSGDASNGGGRGHSCYLLEAPGCPPVMLDFGATALQGLKRLGRRAGEVSALIFTHLHGDHVGGYPYLHIDACFMALRQEPMTVAGPVGTPERLHALLEATYAGLLDKPAPYETRWVELAPGREADVLGYRVRAYAAQHMTPPQQALCLRVTGSDGATVAFSGDTELCAGLFDAARDADLLVAECTGLAPPAGKHCTWAEWRDALPKLEARRVLLTHLSDEVRAALPTLAADAPPGVDLAFADDGLVLDVQAGTNANGLA